MSCADITAIVLTYNEEKNISDCLESLRPLVKRIIVVDSFSTDGTKAICHSFGAEFYEHVFETHSKQFEYGLSNFNIKTKWVIRLDADERLTEESRNELELLCKQHSDDDVNGIVLRFKLFFLGKYLKHGGVYPVKKMQVFKYGTAHIEMKEMDEHIVLDKGTSIDCKQDCLHHDCKSIFDWVEKHNKYSTKEANDYLSNNIGNINLLDHNAKKKAKNKRLFYKLKPGWRARIYHLYRYIFKGGFLDGKQGKYYAFLQAYWYRYLVDIKIYEAKEK